jgi:hypothetical protein
MHTSVRHLLALESIIGDAQARGVVAYVGLDPMAHVDLLAVPKGWLGGHAQEKTANRLDLFPKLG